MFFIYSFSGNKYLNIRFNNLVINERIKIENENICIGVNL